MNNYIRQGKYLITPLTRALDNGWVACSVSIRSGVGQQTTDRVLRLTRIFRNDAAATEYAYTEARNWIGAT